MHWSFVIFAHRFSVIPGSILDILGQLFTASAICHFYSDVIIARQATNTSWHANSARSTETKYLQQTNTKNETIRFTTRVFITYVCFFVWSDFYQISSTINFHNLCLSNVILEALKSTDAETWHIHGKIYHHVIVWEIIVGITSVVYVIWAFVYERYKVKNGLPLLWEVILSTRVILQYNSTFHVDTNALHVPFCVTLPMSFFGLMLLMSLYDRWHSCPFMTDATHVPLWLTLLMSLYDWCHSCPCVANATHDTLWLMLPMFLCD